MKHKIAILGSGNWGSAVARIVGLNVQKYPDLFDQTVKMWTFEEQLPDGSKLTQVINTRHENVKYLPGITLPSNIYAEPNQAESVKNASLLIFVLPHQFLGRLLSSIKDHIENPSRVQAISLIKGIHVDSNGFQPLSRMISQALSYPDGSSVPCSVLMGANVANDVAKDQFCEATIGATSPSAGTLWKNLFHRKTFQIQTIPDVYTVEMCGALKNIVAVAAGFTSGLGYGENTKATIMRIGFNEMRKLVPLCFPEDPRISDQAYFESCGIADLITTCYAGRNFRVSREYAKSGGKKSLEQLEKEMLNGQKLQGTLTAIETYQVLTMMKQTEQFPLFTAVYNVVSGKSSVTDFLDSIVSASYQLSLESSSSSSSNSPLPKF